MDLSKPKKKKRSTKARVIEAVDRVKAGQSNERIMSATGVSYSTINVIRNQIANGEDPYIRSEKERAEAELDYGLPKKNVDIAIGASILLGALALFGVAVFAILFGK